MASIVRHSYSQILKSTVLIGGSQVINILFGIVRVKFMAVLLGPAGVGLIGIYDAVSSVVGTVTGMGIRQSGVRLIAEASGTGDDEKIARTILALRRVALVLGVLGMLTMFALCRPISWLTFGNYEHSGAIALLSFTLLFTAVSGGQTALIQGMRKIADLASLSVIGALLGTACSIPMVYFWGEAGIIPFLISISAMGILTSWFYARKILIVKVTLGLYETWAEARQLLSLGLVFMASALMSTAVAYMVRALVIRQFGLDGVGLYQAAYTLSNLYVGIVLNAMSMDFYPRLTAVAEYNHDCNRLVNEQTEVGLLVAGPGIVATLAFAAFVIQLFYSAQFVPAYEILRWQILGIFFRVVSWPMGFVLLAKGRARIFFWTELVSCVLHVALIWVGLHFFGLEGTGIAVFVLSIFYTIMIFAVVARLTGFFWSPANMRLGLILAPTVAAIFLVNRLLPPIWAITISALLTLAVGVYSIWALQIILGPRWFSSFWTKVQSHLGQA